MAYASLCCLFLLNSSCSNRVSQQLCKINIEGYKMQTIQVACSQPISSNIKLHVHNLFFIGLLLTSLHHNAQQLCGWCQHFISSNYSVFETKEEFSQIPEEVMEYVSQHRWPPISYLEALKEYQSKYGSEIEQEEEADSKIRRRGSRKADKCCVM